MNSVSLNDIIAFLSENQIEHQLVLPQQFNPAELYAFASIKNCIEKGIYYFEDASIVQRYSISNSIIVAKQPLETNNIIIVVKDPQIVHYKLCSLVKPTIVFEISKTTKIHPVASIHQNVSIGENCVIGNCVIEEGVVIKHNVVIEDNVTIKKNTFIDSNSIIGASGIAWIWDEKGNRVLQPQLGGVVVEEDCYIATDVTIVRGSLSENSRVGKGTVISHGTKIGHGVQVMDEVHMANNVSIAGNAVIGYRTFLGSACVISSNVSIAPNCIVGAGAVVNKSNTEEFQTLAGVPAKCIKQNNFESKPNGAPKPHLNH